MAVTLQQIADACGVSRGTVDRALRDRPGVRPEVAQRVREMARQMGYIPRHSNLAEGTRPIRIGVVLHTGSSAFVCKLEQGMLDYPKQAMLPIEVVVRKLDDTNVHHQLALIDELVENEQIDGLALMPLASVRISEKINELSEKRKIPVITLNADIPDCNRLAYIGPDNIACGRTGAALLAMSMAGRGRVLPILGQRGGHFADTQRLSGFVTEMAENFPNIEVLTPEYCFLDSEMAERITRRALQNIDGLTGIYLSTVGRSGVYRAIEQTKNKGNIHVVVHDLVEENLQMIREGIVDFAVGQGWEAQASFPLRMLYQYLVKHVAPSKREYITDIQVKFRCNLGGG